MDGLDPGVMVKAAPDRRVEPGDDDEQDNHHRARRYPAKGAISSRASDSSSSRAIAASVASTLGAGSGRAALPAQSRNLASNCAAVSGFCGEPIGSLASTLTLRPSVRRTL